MTGLTIPKMDLITQSIDSQYKPDRSASVLQFPILRSKHLQNASAEITRANSALSYLSPDVPRGNGSFWTPDGQPETAIWLAVLWSYRGAFGEIGKDDVHEWSKKSNRYTREGFEKDWAAYDADHPNPVTIKSLYLVATTFGWSDDGHNPDLIVPSTSRYALLDRDAILAIPQTQWLIKGLFPATGAGAIYGPSASGKSFLAFDLAFAVASGQPWFGYVTKPRHVVYMMLEGEAGAQNRMVAYERHHHKTVPQNFRVVLQSFCFSNAQDVEDLAAALPVGCLVIIDTLNRAAPGADENSSKDMGHILAGVKRLQEVSQGFVLVVHHTGKDTSKGMRGHSSLFAALDGVIEVQRTTHERSFNAAKVKDGIDGQAIPFELRVIKLGVDDDGDDITSCVVGPCEAQIPLPKVPSGTNQRSALAYIRRLIATSASTGVGGCGPQTQCCTVEDAVEIAASNLTTVAQAKRRNNARSIIRTLIDAGHLYSGLDEHGEGWVW